MELVITTYYSALFPLEGEISILSELIICPFPFGRGDVVLATMHSNYDVIYYYIMYHDIMPCDSMLAFCLNYIETRTVLIAAIFS